MLSGRVEVYHLGDKLWFHEMGDMISVWALSRARFGNFRIPWETENLGASC